MKSQALWPDVKYVVVNYIIIILTSVILLSPVYSNAGAISQAKKVAHRTTSHPQP